MGCNVKILPQMGCSDPADVPCLIVGHLDNLKKVQWSDIEPRMGTKITSTTWSTALELLRPSPTDSCTLGLNTPTIGAFSQLLSRHNTPTGSHHILKLIKSCSLNKFSTESIVVVCKESEVFACGCALGRAFPTFSKRTDRHQQYVQQKTVLVEFIVVGETNHYLDHDMARTLQDSIVSIRLAARIVDTPCNIMHTDAFLDEIRNVGKSLGIEPMIIQGEELDEKGFGGIYGVGKAAIHQPALAVLSHKPTGATQTIAWCGKGIVYDTGGLSIKGKTSMPGMKRDCGGAAAILGAFQTAVKRGFKENLHAVFCLAENAVGPIATRPDDIHTLYSGHTVEINNTDAEGRLVLGDGVAYASKDLKADIVLDMATLTGAQGIATGKYHGAVLTNQEDWEEACVKAGKNSGDLIHPLVFCPELHFQEFNSAVADMKNSVADRGNAQSSCAGLFIASHLQDGFFFKGSWIHIDMASPVHSGERATGYGVALLLSLFGQASHDRLLNLSSPMTTVDQVDNGDSEMGNAKKRRRLI